ncbi:MAG TPA: CHASE2 domain-containing protein, partial [Armatimonadota bacterium]|nr:CHASE2 domain-containing protein [Armatimonadota bacterium]
MVTALVCVLAASRLGMLRAVETRLVDVRLRGPHHAPPVDDLLIVGIEDATLAELKTWGLVLDRSVYAPVIEHLSRDGAKVIVIDVYFGPAETARQSTRVLAGAIADAGKVMLVANAEARLRDGGEAVRFTPPDPELASRAINVASPLLFRPDNIVRWVIPEQEGEENTRYPALSYALAQRMGGARLGAASPSEPLMINWAGPARTVERVKLEDVYHDRVPADKVRGRAVLIGLTNEEEDLFGTPVGPMSGVEAHAQAAATMLSGKLIPGQSSALGLLVALAACILLGLAGAGRSHWQVWAMAAALVVAWLVAGQIAFRTRLVLLPITSVGLSVVVWGVLLSALQSQRVIASLSRLWPSWVKEEGEQLEVTVLVCDVAGYTSRSEEVAPAELMELMRGFFRTVDEVVEPLGGVAARRPGDAALVF